MNHATGLKRDSTVFVSDSTLRDIGDRVRRITQDLKALQIELQISAERDVTGATSELLQNYQGEEMLLEFKRSVDRMRHVLWLYVESAAAQQSPVVDRSDHLKNVTEMLRRLGHVQAVASGQSSFLEQMDAFMDAAVEKPAPPQEARRKAAA
jgi:hypothetical protein